MRRTVGLGALAALLALVVSPVGTASAAGPTAAPGAPNGVSATAGTLAAAVTWAPSGQPASTFTVTSSPGGITATVDGSATSATVTGLGFGLAYTFTVQGVNAIGAGPSSAPSNAVTPLPPGGQYHQAFSWAVFNGNVTAGHPRAVQLGEDPITIPGLSAVVVNVIASNATTASAVQLAVNQQVVQTVAAAVSQVESNLTFVAIPPSLTQAALSVTAGTVHVELDLVGFVTGPKQFAGHGGMLHPVQPALLFNGAVTAGSTTHIPVLGQGDVPAANVSEVLVNLTASGSTAPGSLALEASGLPAWFPQPANALGFAAGQTAANRAIVVVGSDGAIALLDRGAAANVRVEALGWFTSAADTGALGSLFTPTALVRLFDSAAHGGPVAAGSVLTFAVRGQGGVPPSSSTAPPTSAMFQVTASPQGAGSISFAGSPAIYFASGQTTSGLVMSPLGNDGSASFSVNGAATNVTVDLVGYFSGDLIVPGSTKVLTPALLAAITSVGSDYSVTFAPGAQVTPFIQLNDVIVAGVSPTTPMGFLLRVLSITTLPSGYVVLGNRIARLPEALTAFTLDWSLPPTASLFGAVRTSVAHAARPLSSSNPFPPPVGTSIDPKYPDFAIAAPGTSIQFMPAPWAQLSIDDLEIQALPHFHFEYNFFTNQVKAAFAFSVGVRIALSDTITKDFSVLALELYHHQFFIGPKPQFTLLGDVPVVYWPEVTVTLNFDATISVGLSTTYHLDKWAQATVSYDNGQWHAGQQVVEYANGFDPPSPIAQASAQLSLHVIPGIQFYLVLTSGVDISPFIKATVAPLASPWWMLSAGICIGVAETLDLILVKASYSQQFACVEFILLQAPGLKLNVAISPTSATVPRFKTQHFGAGVPGSNKGVIWSVVGGAAAGILSNTTVTDTDYTAPGAAGVYQLKAASIDDPSSFVTADITVPAVAPTPPTGVSAQALPTSALVSWSPPSDNGGATLTGYEVTDVQDGTKFHVTSSVTSFTVPNLTPGSTYTFTVTATNQAGLTSAPSAASAPVTIPNPIPNQVNVTPQNTDFGLVPAGQSVTQTLTVHASSTAAITINSLLLQTGAGMPLDFAIPASTDTCTGAIVPAGGTCTFQVVYVAAAEGYSFAVVYVYYNTPTSVVSAFLNGHAPLPLVGGFTSVTDAQMLDLQHGWAMDGARAMWGTADGNTWTRQVAPAGASFQYHFRFADALHGLALGCAATGPGFCTGFDTAILGTSNGGATWTTLSSIPSLESRGIWFDKDGIHAWAIGADASFNAAMYASSDGGLNWVRQTLPDPEASSCLSAGNLLSSDMSEVRFIDHLNGWAFGSSECQQSGSLAVLSQLTLAWSTADGGATWTAHDTGLNTFFIFPNSRLQVLSPVSIRIAVPIGAASVILATDDGGATFRQMPLPDVARDLSYLDANNAVLITGANGRTVWTSTNGGITWTKTPALLPGLIRTPNNSAINFYGVLETVDAAHWWAFGQIAYADGSPVAGVIEASADASTSWRTQLVGDGTP